MFKNENDEISKKKLEEKLYPLKNSDNISNKSNRKNISSNNIKKKRYILGGIFFICYLIFNFLNNVLIKVFNFDFNYNPFIEIYIRLSLFSFSLIITVYFPHTKHFDKINIMKYYVPDWKKKKKKNLNDEIYTQVNNKFYVYEGTEEKFNKMIQKLSFILMICLYFAISLNYKSFLLNKILYYEDKNKNYIHLLSIFFPLGSLIMVLFLRKFFLMIKKLTYLAKISSLCIIIGVYFLFKFHLHYIKLHDNYINIYLYSFFGGLFFGIFGTLLKYFSNLYGKNFKLSSILGYIGLYNFIIMPVFISIVIYFTNDSNEFNNMFSYGNSILCYLLMIILNLLEYIGIFFCVIGFSPFAFSFLLFFQILFETGIHIAFKEITGDWKYVLAFIFICIGIGIGIIDKIFKIKKKNKKNYVNKFNHKEMNNINKSNQSQFNNLINISK